MQQPDDSIKKHSQKNYNARNPLLFTIPNPFDDYLPKKNRWYQEVKKMEESIKSVRQKINLIAERQQHNRRAIQAINEYCDTRVKGKKLPAY